ncbi:MAG: hypothetical protein QM214_01385 [Bacillota bacterium]|jgi:ABC-type oligopeptide transport system substrate-binding subunit|nr:hypothetical protein [Bacillota bacterium]HHU43277.1 hypothetical protein [Clostridiales bacterium]
MKKSKLFLCIMLCLAFAVLLLGLASCNYETHGVTKDGFEYYIYKDSVRIVDIKAKKSM